MTTHRERCKRESTRDVIFLFQEKIVFKTHIYWKTIGVWLDRKEAERWGKQHEYRFVHGWHVYGVPAEGRLAKMLQGQDEEVTDEH